MARSVEEIMNPEALSVRPDESVDRARRYILAMHVTGAPVVDADGRPRGVVSLRDLVDEGGRGSTVGERMTAPAATVLLQTTLEAAARRMADTNYHRLVVVDEQGRTAGIVSALDLVREMAGRPPRHPAEFPHYDRRLGVTWTDVAELEPDAAQIAPDGPGVLVLVRGGPGAREQIVWLESVLNVRTRLFELASIPQSDEPILGRILERGHLRFRAASVRDWAERRRALDALLRLNPGLRAPEAAHLRA